jgi:hypothetical protein
MLKNIIRLLVVLKVQQQFLLKEESTLKGTHFYFQSVGVGGSIQLLGEDIEEQQSVSRLFSLFKEIDTRYFFNFKNLHNPTKSLAS